MECVMSVVPRPWPQPAAEIVAAVAAMYRGRRERPLPVLVRDKLGEWLADDQFAGAYGVRGKPGWPVGAENLCHLCRCPLGAVGSVACPVRGWQVLASVAGRAMIVGLWA
jgi:hypothetical protein